MALIIIEGYPHPAAIPIPAIHHSLQNRHPTQIVLTLGQPLQNQFTNSRVSVQEDFVFQLESKPTSEAISKSHGR